MARKHWVVAAAVVSAFAPFATDARADDKECMSAASRGQEVRDEGKLVEARTFFQKCADTSCPAPIPKYCADWLADVVRKTPSISFRAQDPAGRDLTDATALIDGKQSVPVDGQSVDVDPGKHKVRFTRSGSRPFDTDVVVAQGEKDRVIVGTLSPEATKVAGGSQPSNNGSAARVDGKRDGVPMASWISWGVGAAAFASFAIFGLKARIDYDSFESSCGTRCTTSARDEVASSVMIADVSLVVSLVAAGAGTLFYLTRPTASSSSTAATR